MLVEEASNVTIERGSKRVEAYHLYVSSHFSSVPAALTPSPAEPSHVRLVAYRKHAIDTVDMLDFLKEIVEGVPDPSAGGTIDVEAENAEARSKKRGKGKDKKAAPDSNGGDKPAPKRRRRKAADKAKEDEKEDEQENEMDEDEDEDEGHGGRYRRDDDDDEWAG